MPKIKEENSKWRQKNDLYSSYDELREAIEKYIKYYNEKRIKEKLGWLSPVQYRQRLLAA